MTAFRRIIRWLAIAAGICIVGGAALPSLAKFILHELPFMGRAFSSNAWAEAGSCAGLTDLRCEEKWQRCERGAMFRSLVNSHLIVGKTSRTEALALLGDQSRMIVNGGSCMRYTLGYCSGLGMDMDYAVLCFDVHDVLTAKYRHQS